MSHLKSCQFINSFNQSEVSKFDDDLPINSSQIAKVASSSWCNHFIKLGKLKTHPGNPNLFWNIFVQKFNTSIYKNLLGLICGCNPLTSIVLIIFLIMMRSVMTMDVEDCYLSLNLLYLIIN